MTEGTPHPTTPPRRFRAVLLNVALLGVGTLIALLLAELAVRIAAPQQLRIARPDIWQAADSLGWVNRPNVVTAVNTGEGTVVLRTDSNGLRVGAAGHPPASTRVLVIGDSFMEALQVEYEQSLAGLLQDSLTRRLGRPVDVWNTGVNGWDPPHYLVRARQMLRAQHFDALLVSLYLGNDVVKQRRDYIPPRAPIVVHDFTLPRGLSWRAFVRAFLYPINDQFERHSHLFVLLRTRLHPLLLRVGLAADDFPEELFKHEEASPRWNVTASLCREISDAAQAAGVPTLIILIPSPYAIDTAAFRVAVAGFGINPDSVDVDQPPRLMKAALDADGLTVLDALPTFREQRAQGPLYGKVDQHLSPLGHRVLSGIVVPRLVDLMKAAVPPGGGHDGSADSRPRTSRHVTAGGAGSPGGARRHGAR